MDWVTTISVVTAITAALSWISLRWFKSTTIGVPALTALAVVALVAGGSRVTSIRQWCTDLTTVFDPPFFFFGVVAPLLLFTASACFAFNPLASKQIASSGAAVFRGLLTALGVAGIVSYTSRGSIPWSECMLFRGPCFCNGSRHPNKTFSSQFGIRLLSVPVGTRINHQLRICSNALHRNRAAHTTRVAHRVEERPSTVRRGWWRSDLGYRCSN